MMGRWIMSLDLTCINPWFLLHQRHKGLTYISLNDIFGLQLFENVKLILSLSIHYLT